MRYTPKKTLQLITEQGNNYLVGVKANQPKLMQEIKGVSQQQQPISIETQHERTRDRYVERTITVYDDVSGLEPKWAQPQSLIVVRRCGTRSGQPFDQVSYYLSSLKASALNFGLGIRGHRLIENSLHWVKDVVFREDDAPFPAHNPATNWSIVRSFVLNLLHQHGYQAISQALRLLRHDLDALFHLLTMN